MKVRISTPRVIALILSALIPLAILALGGMLLLANSLLNFGFIFSFIVLPICCLVFSALLIFSNMKPVIKFVLNILVIFIISIAFLVSYLFGTFEMIHHYENDDVAKPYEEVISEFETMPSLSEIGEPISLDYYDYFSQSFGIFTCDADILICEYSETDYEKQKSVIESKYIFQAESMAAHEYVCDPTVAIDGYLFRTISVNGEYGNEIYYPKRLVFVATNDSKKEIVYMSFYDDDRDYIESLEGFINDECGWKHIK